MTAPIIPPAITAGFWESARSSPSPFDAESPGPVSVVDPSGVGVVRNEGREFPDPADRFSPEPSVEAGDDSSWLKSSDNVFEVSRTITWPASARLEIGAEIEADKVEDSMKDAGDSPATSDEVGSASWVNDAVV